jgi:1-pyrroline-4-hydroxy-2-carboxylate deaminase
MRVHWQGVFSAITTQFRHDQSLDLAATSKHLSAMMEAGLHGVVVLGTVGENTALEYQEKLEVIRELRQTTRGRIPLLTGVAEYTTVLASRFARDAERAGAEGLMVLPGMVYKSDERETLAHFRGIAQSTGLPIMIYNNPVSYGVDLVPEAFVELAGQPNIVAIKESSEDVRRITDLYNTVGDRFVLFAGVDDLILESIALGAQGWISGLVNAFPQESRELWDLATSGNWQKALDLYRWYTPLLHLDTKVKLVQYIKLAMQETCLGSELTRAPRLPLMGAEREEILGVIRQAIATRPAVGTAAVQ